MLLLLFCMGCEKKVAPVISDGSFKFLDHPGSLNEEQSGVTFDELMTIIEDRYPHGRFSSTEHRRGFSPISGEPIVFDVDLPRNAVFSFEWSAGPKAKMSDLRAGFSVVMKVGDQMITRNISIEGREDLLNRAWFPETFPLDELPMGKARILFFGATEPKSDPREKFRIANPRVFSHGRTSHRRVILIALDTLRADHLSSYGYEKLTSPAIDKLAGDGTRYEYCLATSPWTFPSFSSIHTGKYPSVCGATTNVRFLPDEETTIAEILSFNGFSTFMCVNHVWAGPPVNHHQGFDRALRFPLERSRVTLDLAADWLNEHRDEDTFMFLQFMEPHVPYIPDPPYNKMFSSGYSGKYEKVFHEVEELRSGELQLDDNEIRQIEALYDGEIAFFDNQLSVFIDFLKDQDLYDETLIIFTSDHGEEFFEHGGFEHGHSLYDEQLHVPLIIKGPKIEEGSVRDDPVSTMDIFPTILEYFMIPPPVGVNGISLLSNRQESGRMLLAEQLRYGEELKSVTTKQYRYIYHTSDGTEELYDLNDDPGMTESVAMDRRAKSREFRAFVESYISRNGSLWYVSFQLAGPAEKAVTYSGSITAPGGFSFTDGKLFDESDTFNVDGDTIQFELLLTQPSEKEIRFTLADDNAEVLFEIFKDGLTPAPETIFIGPAMEAFNGIDLVLDLTDARFNLGQPMLRRETHDGVFIWANPAPARAVTSPDLTDEMIEELRSIGYFN